jgi:hypothetical protein
MTRFEEIVPREIKEPEAKAYHPEGNYLGGVTGGEGWITELLEYRSATPRRLERQAPEHPPLSYAFGYELTFEYLIYVCIKYRS